MAATFKRKRGAGPRVRPSGEVRRSQAIRTYGAGAMIDLIDVAVVQGGLEFWRADPEVPIREDRLRDAVLRMIAGLEPPIELDLDRPFLSPPIADSNRDPEPGVGIEAFEFPAWFVCQNPRCRALATRGGGLEESGGKWLHFCGVEGGRAGSTAVPVRFVMACPCGHLDEVPWVAFVHEMQGRPRCGAAHLTFKDPPSGDFGEITIECVCSQQPRKLAELMVEAAMPRCTGRRPWLGREADEECGEPMRLLVRSASNAYFAQVVSALSIPDDSQAAWDRVKSVWDVLQAATRETLPVFRTIAKVSAAIGELTNDQVLDYIEKIKAGRAPERPPLRTAEFLRFTSEQAYETGDQPPPNADFFARDATAEIDLPAAIARVVLAFRLREVEAQIGFTRLEPPTSDLQGEFNLGVETARLSQLRRWLPAIELRGEGVFVQLDEKAVRDWEDRPAVRARAEELQDGFESWKKARQVSGEFLGIRYYLLHSLSHLVINAISLTCGYSASALRERIYCASRHDRVPMAAILITTGTPGTEGTLGGLVEQGFELRDHLRHAWDLGRLCSNDPVCAGHSPRNDRSERWREGASCHGCLLIAEPSCERFNQFLDRATVVPIIGHHDIAFFRDRP